MWGEECGAEECEAEESGLRNVGLASIRSAFLYYVHALGLVV